MRGASVAYIALAALIAPLAGCPDPQSGATNGVDRVLYFSGVESGDFGAVPVGVPWRVTVSRYTSGIEVCEPSLSPHGNGDCTGGSSPDPLTIESAVCETLACTFDIDTERSVIRFSSTTSGATRLRVRTRSKSDGKSYSDAFTVRFADVARLELWQEPSELMAVAMPISPGITFVSPNARLVAADGTRLKIEDGVVSRTLGGTSLKEDFPGVFSASVPGVSTLTWNFRDALKRSLDVEVIEPAVEEAIVVLPSVQKRTDLFVEEGVELDGFLAQIEGGASVDVIERSSKRDNFFHYHPVYVRLADGRRALVPITKSAISPSDGAGVSTRHPWTVEVYSTGATDATLHLEAGSASRDLPVHFL